MQNGQEGTIMLPADVQSSTNLMKTESMNYPNQMPTIVIVSEEVGQVRDHLVWSILNVSYMNVFCIGLIALIFSVKSRDRKLVGDKQGAKHYAATARTLNIIASGISIVFLIIAISTIIITYVYKQKLLEQLEKDLIDGKV